MPSSSAGFTPISESAKSRTTRTPVHTFWDIGVGDSTAIWFVREVGNEFHIIDYYENSGEGLRHYMKVLKDKGYMIRWSTGGRTILKTVSLEDAKSAKS
jgi:hypothetical protein